MVEHKKLAENAFEIEDEAENVVELVVEAEGEVVAVGGVAAVVVEMTNDVRKIGIVFGSDPWSQSKRSFHSFLLSQIHSFHSSLIWVQLQTQEYQQSQRIS